VLENDSRTMLGCLGRAFVAQEAMGVKAINKTRVDRTEKNRMRTNLEEVFQLQKELEKRLNDFLQVETVDNYRLFWQELKNQQTENLHTIYNYMVRKCNR